MAIGIWQVSVSDGTASYFDSEVEADFFFKDTREAGFSVRQQFIPLPQTPKDFAAYMERLDRDLFRPVRKVTDALARTLSGSETE